MGTPGVKSKITKSQIAQAILNSDGYAIDAMIELDCREEFFYNKLKEYPDLKILLDEQRSKKKSRLNRKSETTLEWTLDNKEIMPSIAQRTAMYILDNQAKDMGYNKQEEQNTSAPRDEILKQEQIIIDLKYENIKLKNDSQRQTDSKL